MSFKKDRKHDLKLKTQRRLFRLIKNKAKDNLKDKFRKLEDNKSYNLKDLGFKQDMIIQGKDIKKLIE